MVARTHLVVSTPDNRYYTGRWYDKDECFSFNPNDAMRFTSTEYIVDHFNEIDNEFDPIDNGIYNIEFKLTINQ